MLKIEVTDDFATLSSSGDEHDLMYEAMVAVNALTDKFEEVGGKSTMLIWSVILKLASENKRVTPEMMFKAAMNVVMKDAKKKSSNDQ